MLPGPDASKDSFTKLDTLGGKSVKLDELGPMVVNTDGVRRFVAWELLSLTDTEGWKKKPDPFPNRKLDANNRYGTREDA